MSREIDLISYIPPSIQEYEDYRVITDIENDEVQNLFNEIDVTAKNMFILSAGDIGLKRYEKIVKVRPKATDTLETRRLRILDKWNESVPYTWKFLINKLNLLYGVDGYEIDLDADKYQIDLEIKSFDWTMFLEVVASLRKIVPANIVMGSTLVNEVKGNTHFGATTISGEEVTIYPYAPSDIESKGNVNISMGYAAGVEEITIYPKGDD